MKTPLTPSLFILAVASFLGTAAAHAQSVSVSAWPSTITNSGNDESTITLTISPPPSRKIAINFYMTGTARFGRDYILFGDFDDQGRVMIAPGQSTSIITLRALADDDPTLKETAVFNIIGGNRYRIGRPSHTQITIQNVE